MQHLSPVALTPAEAPPPFRTDAVANEPFSLLGTCCGAGHVNFPARDLCPTCHRQDVATVPLSGAGRLHSFSEVHQAPPGVDVPYVLGWVDLEEGCRILARIASHGDVLTIGDTVRCRPATFLDPSGSPVLGFEFEVTAA